MLDLEIATPFQVEDLAEEIVPSGALVEAKQDAIHYITVLVIGYYPYS